MCRRICAPPELSIKIYNLITSYVALHHLDFTLISGIFSGLKILIFSKENYISYGSNV